MKKVFFLGFLLITTGVMAQRFQQNEHFQERSNGDCTKKSKHLFSNIRGVQECVTPSRCNSYQRSLLGAPFLELSLDQDADKFERGIRFNCDGTVLVKMLGNINWNAYYGGLPNFQPNIAYKESRQQNWSYIVNGGIESHDGGTTFNVSRVLNVQRGERYSFAPLMRFQILEGGEAPQFHYVVNGTFELVFQPR